MVKASVHLKFGEGIVDMSETPKPLPFACPDSRH
ncbi:MAG: hypothetical protein OGMRLDGQ_002997 [Candidatus Fervidibacter sp.]